MNEPQNPHPAKEIYEEHEIENRDYQIWEQCADAMKAYYEAKMEEWQADFTEKMATKYEEQVREKIVRALKAGGPLDYVADSILSLVGSRQEGRQEVIDWVNNHRGLWNQWTLWVAQLKEWGIKEGK